MESFYKSLAALGLLITIATWASVAVAEEYRLDDNTKYRVLKNQLGFNLEVEYSEYQFIPSPQKLTAPCVEVTLLIAEQISKKKRALQSNQSRLIMFKQRSREMG